jgi:hypothetical protein
MKIRWYYTILILFSIIIITLESKFGQDYVRHYLTDLKGPVLFYGIQTTITTVLLVIISYNFILTYFFAKNIPTHPKNFKLFFLSQALVFLFLAVDERFMIHERIAFVLKIHDAIPLLGIAVFQLLIFIYYRVYCKTLIYWNSPIVLGSICFAVMILIDAFAPLNAGLRLSFEDLFKLWGIFFFFRYSCKIFLEWVRPAKKAAIQNL